MGKMYTLTEDNYMEVLHRLEKICNRFRLFTKYEVFELNTPKRNKRENYSNKIYENKSWGTRTVFDGVDYENQCFITHEEKFSVSRFIHPTKHSFKTAYEETPDSYDGKHWLTTKPLIHINTDASGAIVLTYGDKVQFEKWGFIVYTDNDYIRFERKLNVYKNTFIIDRVNGRIENLEEEIQKRNAEWEEDAAWWNEQYEKDLELDFWDMEDDEMYEEEN